MSNKNYITTSLHTLNFLFIIFHYYSLLFPFRDLLKLASSKLAPLIGQGTPYAGPKGDEKEILELLKFYQEISSDVSAYFVVIF